MLPELAEVAQAIESAFDLRLEREELTDETTVDELLLLIERKEIPTPPRGVCLTAAMFWRMRRAAGIIASDSKIRTTSVLAIRNRSVWRRFALTAGGYRVPGLDHGPIASLIIFGVPCLILVFAWISLSPSTNLTILARCGFGFLLFMTWIVLTAATARLMQPFASRLPDHVTTAGSLAQTMSSLNYARLARECGGKTDGIAPTPRQLADLHTAIFHVLGLAIGVNPEFVRNNLDTRISDLIEANDGPQSGIH
jgi:hypothetical protein